LIWSNRAATLRRIAGPPLAAAALLAAAGARLRAQTIDTIIVVNRNVFDPGSPADDAPGFLARLANRLHVRTRAGVIRRALLVNPGDRYDSARVAESERALRNLFVFRRVRLDTTRLDGRLALRVATSDGWSTKPQLGYSSAGGDASWLLGVVEENFLGTATAVSAVYNKTPDRTSVELAYLNPHFVGRRMRLLGQYVKKSDGTRGLWELGLPFYETAARHALLADGEAASERVLLFRDGLPDTARFPLGSAERRALRLRVTAGLAPHATSRNYLRLWAAGEWRREDFVAETAAVVPRSVFGAVGAGVDLARVRFQVLERFNSYARREDVDVSRELHLGVWAAPRAWGYPAAGAGIGPEASAQIAAVWPRGFAVLRGGANGVFTAAGTDSTRIAGAFTVASQALKDQTVIVHLEGARLERPKPGNEFDLWLMQTGPRVFGIHQFTGTRMAWLAIEDRVLVADEVWGLLGVGVAPFLDYGGAWYGDEPARLGGDVGVSLRIGPTRAVRGDVAELAVGYRFGKGFTGNRWGVAIRKGIVY
jgi:hypothetical protein